MKKIIINYKNTGAQTLRGTAYFAFGAGLLATLIAFINCFSLNNYDIEFIWGRLVNVLLILVITLFCSGISFALSYLSESAFVARKQREELLAAKGIELEFLEKEETIRIKEKKTGWISEVTLSHFENLKAQNGEDTYEVLGEKLEDEGDEDEEEK